MFNRAYYKGCEYSISGDINAQKDSIKRYEASKKWIAEPKLDGIWYVLNDDIGYTRRGNTRGVYLPPIGKGTVIVGELAESTEEAIRRKSEVGHTFVDVFDILSYKGRDTTDIPLLDRKGIIESWHKKLDENSKEYFNVVSYYESDFAGLYEKEKEGIVLKRANGTYRDWDDVWIKVKKEYTWDFVVVGYEVSDAESKSYTKIARNVIGAQYIGEILVPMVRIPIDTNTGRRVVDKFHLFKNTVVEVRGFSRTKKGSVRSPRFVRFRDDKPARDCVFAEG